MHGRSLTLVVLAGCGRVGFHPTADAAIDDDAITVDAPALPLCFADDFSDGIADGWFADGGRWVIGTGRDGPALTDVYLTQTTFTRQLSDPSHDVFDLEFDADITSRATGDLFVQLNTVGGMTYQVSLFPIGSDDPIDSISITPATYLAMTGNLVSSTPGTWSHVRVVYNAGMFDVFIDGAVHLHAVDTALAPPFAYQVGFTFGGAFDNFTLHCQ